MLISLCRGTVVEPPKPSPPPPAPVAQAASAKDAASKTWSAEQVAKFKRMLTNGTRSLQVVYSFMQEPCS